MENIYADQSQIYKSFNRKKKNQVVIAPYSQDCYFNFEEMYIEIKERVDDSDFDLYAEEIIQTTSFFFIKLGDAKKRLKYSEELLVPLTKLDGEIKKMGLKVFDLILKICSERKN